MRLIFRQMTADDLQATFDVRPSTVENAITMDRLKSDYGSTPESVADAMTRDVQGWLCEDSGFVVGFAMGNVSSAEVLVVAVRPEYEGHGVGKGVLEQVGSWLFSAGHDEIWLLTTPDPTLRAYGFYLSLGWRATDKIVRDDELMLLRKAAS